MKIPALFYSFVVTVSLSACGPKQIFDETQNISAEWSYEDTITFQVSIEDTLQAYDLVLNVNHLDQFKYQNLYLNISTIFPDDNTISDILSLDLRDKAGYSNGQCRGDDCSIEFILEDGIRFRKEGQYTFKINQHSREEQLLGINSLRLKIVEDEE